MEYISWMPKGESYLITVLTLIMSLGIVAGYLAFAYSEYVVNTAILRRKVPVAPGEKHPLLLLTSLCVTVLPLLSMLIVANAMYCSLDYRDNFLLHDSGNYDLYFAYRILGMFPEQSTFFVPLIVNYSPIGMALGFAAGLALSWRRYGHAMRITAIAGGIFVLLRIAYMVIGAGLFDLGYFFVQSDLFVAAATVLLGMVYIVISALRGLNASHVRRWGRYFWNALRYVFILTILVFSAYFGYRLVLNAREFGLDADVVFRALLLVIALTTTVILIARWRARKSFSSAAEARPLSRKQVVSIVAGILLLATFVFASETVFGPYNAIYGRLVAQGWNPTPVRPVFGKMKPCALFSIRDRDRNGTYRYFPVRLAGNVVAVAASEKLTAALFADGSISIYRPIEDRNGEAPLETISDFTGRAVDVELGEDHMLVLLDDGTVYARGNNQNGQLGQGDEAITEGFVKVPDLAGITYIYACSDFSAAIRHDGAVYWWGGYITSYKFTILLASSARPERIPDICAVQVNLALNTTQMYDRWIHWGMQIIDNRGRTYRYNSPAKELTRLNLPFLKRSLRYSSDFLSRWHDFIDGNSFLVYNTTLECEGRRARIPTGYGNSTCVEDTILKFNNPSYPIPVIGTADGYVITDDGQLNTCSMSRTSFPDIAHAHSLCDGENRVLILVEE